MVEKAAQAVDDGKPEPEATTAVSVGTGKPIELAEDAPPLILGDAHAAVADVEAQLSSVAPATNDDAPLVCIANGVGNQVEQDALKQDDVAADPGPARNSPQTQALLARGHGEGRLDPAKQVIDRELQDAGDEHAGIEL